MIKRCDINDTKAVDQILRHPAVFNHIVDDFSLPIELFTAKPFLNADGVYVLMDLTETFCSMFIPLNGILYIGHQNVLPEVRGKKAIRIGKQMCRWMFDNTNCKKIIGQVPEYNRPAKMFAYMMGFTYIGRIRNAWQKNGKLYALDMVSLEKKGSV